MAALNLSTNGASIAKSYQAVIDAPAPSGPAAASPTYGQWAIFSVTAPLISAFQQGPGKESVLKVESTGEGELQDLIEDFSDGRIQFAFVKIKDPNTGLQKNALVGWCGEGVPERTKGYFSSHQAAVAKLLQGYHVQISARSDRDLTPDGIIQKVSDASGAKYSSSEKPSKPAAAPPPLAKKPVFTPSAGGASPSAYNPLASRRTFQPASSSNIDADGWGDDAPPVTRTQLEKVASAYRPTKVDINQLRGQEREESKLALQSTTGDPPDVVKGGYQPVGKVDIAAIRKQAAESGQLKDERPAPVKGSYEPVGTVDLAAIRARAQPPPPSSQASGSASLADVSRTSNEAPESISDRATAVAAPGRLAELPKPKISNQFGSGSSSFAGTKAPTPGQFGLQSGGPDASTPPMGAGRSFASSAGKTPAQIWAEKKAAQGADSLSSPPPPSAGASTPLSSQASGGWKSGYEGKKWAAVQTSKTGASATSAEHPEFQQVGEDQQETGFSAPVGSLRDQLDRGSLSQPPALDNTNKPTFGGSVALPRLPAQSNKEEDEEQHISTQPLPPPPPVHPHSPSPEPAAIQDEKEHSPVRIAVPVARSAKVPIQDAHDEQTSPPPTMPIRSLAQKATPQSEEDEEPDSGPDPARSAAEAAAATTFGETAVATANPGDTIGGKRATAQYDYEKAEDNELELREGDLVTGIEMVDTDWWMGRNPRGETGLFPSNYVEVIENEIDHVSHQIPVAATSSPAQAGKTAVAQYDYEAAEDNELSFPEGAKITNIEFPDEDWWMGEYNGAQGLFPSNYVELDS